MRKTSSNEPLYDSLTLDSSPGNDLSTRRDLKKENKTSMQIRHIKPQLEHPARSRGGSWVYVSHLELEFFLRGFQLMLFLSFIKQIIVETNATCLSFGSFRFHSTPFGIGVIRHVQLIHNFNIS